MINLELKVLTSMIPIQTINICGQWDYRDTIEHEFPDGSFISYQVRVISEPVGNALSYIDNGHITTEHAELSRYVDVLEVFLYDKDGEEIELTSDQYEFLRVELKNKML